MSLFKEPFNPNIAGQLNARQNLIGRDNKTPSDIAYLNSKTAWVKLQSSVNINGLPDLAKQHILLGGVLYDNKIKGGVGINNDKAYYLKQSNGETNLLGIKPMPGITNMSIQNKGAYGSLRQASINFQCWDVRQLEILEQLYMRPGYTVLIEWGWLPYINNSGKLEQTLYDDNFFSRSNLDIQSYLKELYQKSTKSNGNYEAMFGYIMNYNWKMRNDGGYDCSLEIISTGEVLESYKVNFNGAQATSYPSLLLGNALPSEHLEQINKEYSKNILSGLISEVYSACYNGESKGSLSYTFKNKKGTIDFASQTFDLDVSGKWLSFNTEFLDKLLGDDDKANADNPGGNNLKGSLLEDRKNVFITLKSFVDLLNNFVLLENSNNSSSLIKLSVNDRDELDKANLPLYCLYHPLQISVDPRVCIINNEEFFKSIGGINIQNNSTITDTGKTLTKVTVPNKLEFTKEAQDIAKNIDKLKKEGASRDEIAAELKKIKDENELTQVANLLEKTNNGKSLTEILEKDTIDYLGNNSIPVPAAYLKNIGLEKATSITNYNSSARLNRELAAAKQEQEAANKSVENITKSQYLDFCSTLSPFVQNNLGNISNIYVNLKLLYTLINDESTKSSDPSEKQSINLISYIKNVLTYIQNATGNVNNFEVVIDGNTGYIVDVNYVPSETPIPFTFELGNKNTIVRDVNVESQIFSDQSTIIAISAQSQAGKLGLENSSMVAYNKGLTDRMIFQKDNPVSSGISANSNMASFARTLIDLGQLFEDIQDDTNGQFSLDVDKIDGYKTALSDLIAYFTGFYISNNKYRSILPTKVSLTIDGIGGLVIGNIFNLNKDFIPQAYKGDKTGVDLQYIITGIKQSINDNTWITTIEGNPFIPDSALSLLNQGFENFNLNTTVVVTYEIDPKTQKVVAKYTLKSFDINSPVVKQNISVLDKALAGKTIEERKAIASVVLKESGGIPQSEGSYSTTGNDRLRTLFKSRLAGYSDAELDALKKDNVKFYNAIYGPEADKKVGLGLGNITPEDGFKYRGRGFNQITGRAAYEKYGKKIGVDLVKNPDLANKPEIAAKITAAMYDERKSSMSKQLGYSDKLNQEQANILATNVTAGSKVRNLNKEPFAEQYAKVTAYSNNATLNQIIKKG